MSTRNSWTDNAIILTPEIGSFMLKAKVAYSGVCRNLMNAWESECLSRLSILSLSLDFYKACTSLVTSGCGNWDSGDLDG